jgi:hypothetical protein
LKVKPTGIPVPGSSLGSDSLKNPPAAATTTTTVIIPTNIKNAHLRKSLQLQNQRVPFSSDSSSATISISKSINLPNTPHQLHYPHDHFIDKHVSIQDQLRRAYEDAYQYCTCEY